jgi:hypothetical protein
VVLGQRAADPHTRGDLVLRRADDLAAQVLRSLDAAVSVDVDRRVPEDPRREDGDRDERPVGRQQRQDVRRQRHLRHVELPVAQHPEEGLLGTERQAGQLQPLRPDPAVEQRGHAVVAAHGERQRQPRAHRRARARSAYFSP